MALRNFRPEEFRQWWFRMDDTFLARLDDYRDALGWPILISPAEGSLGRTDEKSKGSQHYYSEGRKLRVADIMPTKFGIGLDIGELEYAFSLAKKYFNGVGVYPDWKPYPGLHVDLRTPKSPGHIATWAGVKKGKEQVYVSTKEVFNHEPA